MGNIWCAVVYRSKVDTVMVHVYHDVDLWIKIDIAYCYMSMVCHDVDQWIDVFTLSATEFIKWCSILSFNNVYY